MALAAGVAILGASFLLLWACDAAQTDISQALALAVVALIAVLPEYSVDMYFTWQAGKHPESDYAHYAIANMTGANRLLIGVAWGLIVALYWFRFRKPVRIEAERRTELLFLGAATVYAFLIPLKGSLAWYDGVVLLGIYAAYIVVAARRKCPECEVEGPAELLVRLPAAQRRLATAGMFLFAAWVILVNAEPFCEGLLGTGRAFHINEFCAGAVAGADCFGSARVHRRAGVRLARAGGARAGQPALGQAQPVDPAGGDDPRRVRPFSRLALAPDADGRHPDYGDHADRGAIACWAWCCWPGCSFRSAGPCCCLGSSRANWCCR